jgi:hypothetical protein
MRARGGRLAATPRLAAAAILVLLAPVPAAADDCSPLERIVDLAAGMFEDLPLGSYDEDLEEYDAEIMLDGASSCAVDKSDQEYDVSYSCQWWYSNGTDAQRESAYRGLRDYVVGCLRDGAISNLDARFVGAPQEDTDDRGASTQVRARNTSFPNIERPAFAPRIIFTVSGHRTRKNSQVVSLKITQETPIDE